MIGFEYSYRFDYDYDKLTYNESMLVHMFDIATLGIFENIRVYTQKGVNIRCFLTKEAYQAFYEGYCDEGVDVETEIHLAIDERFDIFEICLFYADVAEISDSDHEVAKLDVLNYVSYVTDKFLNDETDTICVSDYNNYNTVKGEI